MKTFWLVVSWPGWIVMAPVAVIATLAWARYLKPPKPPKVRARGIGIIMRPSEDDHADMIRQERLAMASNWLQAMPKLPPNCERMTVVMHYDDGKQLSMQIREAE